MNYCLIKLNYGHNTDEPDIYINEKTGKEITTAEMEVKERNKCSNVNTITILSRSRHE